MSKSSLTLDSEGNISMVLADQVELTEDERSDINKLSNHLGMLSNVERTFRKERQRLEIALMSVPEYQGLLKFAEKLKTVKELQKRTRILLDAEYDKVFDSRNLSGNAAELYAGLLPDTNKPTSGKRGRPRKELTA